MSTSVSNEPTHVVVRLIGATAVYGGMLFLLAGTVRWPAAWAYLAIVTIVLAVYVAILKTRHPDLIEERAHPPADAKAWDKPFIAIVSGVGPIGLLVVAALDRRFGWTGPVPEALIVVGLLLVAAGGTLTNCAVAANRFFSAVVRIQRERGHSVVDAGPYRYVRHPGYVGSILHMTGTAFALGSGWTLLLAVAVSLVLAVRTGLEDKTLQDELEGYTEYARRVRYRLVPGLW